MIKVAPSILSADFTDMKSAVKLMESAGADYIHCDVMDGVFVPNISFGQPMIKALKKITKLPLDVHLMIINPERYIDEFIDAGADILTIHAESTSHLCRALQSVKARGVISGVSLNPHTPLEILDYLYDYIDMVLLMSVNPGFGGQALIPSVLDKSRKLKSIIDKKRLNIDIEMDGGIYEENAREVIDAGVNIIVAGSAVFNADNPQAAIKKLKSIK